ncbi:MAG: cytochrome c oxidase subunit 3 [Candidatus Sumerlaeia bacterium]|nr:cytochrome c oxidase subunit 3 [Candidatus Sumerlaeia bacterium]
MSSPAAAHGHAHDEEHIHMPSPSIWPFLAGLALLFAPVAVILMGHGRPDIGLPLLAMGTVLAVVPGIGWCVQVIREKAEVDLFQSAKDLSMSWKLFLVSEAAIFGAFFGYYFAIRWAAGHNWPPPGSPHIDPVIPILGTVMLVTSSFTCELGHKALVAGKRALCKNWTYVTIALGLAFLSLQAYEWGYLGAYDQFKMGNNVFATCFYMITGWHGFHVITGLLMLIMVYARLEGGAFSRKRHFSMLAASWYWHFVDVIWILVLFSIYLL